MICFRVIKRPYDLFPSHYAKILPNYVAKLRGPEGERFAIRNIRTLIVTGKTMHGWYLTRTVLVRMSVMRGKINLTKSELQSMLDKDHLVTYAAEPPVNKPETNNINEDVMKWKIIFNELNDDSYKQKANDLIRRRVGDVTKIGPDMYTNLIRMVSDLIIQALATKEKEYDEESYEEPSISELSDAIAYYLNKNEEPTQALKDICEPVAELLMYDYDIRKK